MTPSYKSKRMQLIMTGVLLALMSGPLILGKLDLLDSVDMFATSKIFAIKYLVNQIRKGPAEIDIAFIGSSDLSTSISASIIQQELSEKLGRPATVRNFSAPLGKAGYSLVVAETLLKTKKVKLLVIELQIDGPIQKENLVFNWWQAWAHRKLTAQLPIADQISLYAEAVLGVPQQLLSLVRANDALGLANDLSDQLSRIESAHGSFEVKRNFGEAELRLRTYPEDDIFTEKNFAIPAFNPEDLIFRASKDANPKHFVQNWNLTEKQIAFYSRIRELAEIQGGKIIFLRVNRPWENTSTADIPKNIPDSLKSVPILVIPETWLTGKYDSETKRLALYNLGHRNLNGMRLFTKAVAPAILQIYSESHESH